ncbi:hypothetical protein AB0J52_12180 [Spirillospora sp. NPDC049652]
MPETIVLVMAISLVAMAMVSMAVAQLAVILLLGRQHRQGRPADTGLSTDTGGQAGTAPDGPERAMLLLRERTATMSAAALVPPPAEAEAKTPFPPRPSLAIVPEERPPDRTRHAAPAPAPAGGGPPRGALWQGTRDCTIMFVDIAGFGSARRTERDRRTIRDVTYTLVLDALDGVGAGPSVWYREDRGDGALLLLPADVPAGRLVTGAVPALLDGLRAHDRSAGPGLDLRLRVSLDAGRAAVDERGAFGDSVIAASRLLDAPLLKERLTEPGRLLGLILSPRVHEALPDKDGFERIDVHVKEHRLVGWTAVYGADAERHGEAGGGGVDRRTVLPPVRTHRARRLIRTGRMAG